MSNPATIPHALGKYHCPRKLPQSLLGVTIFSEKLFPTMAYCIFCDTSQFTTPPPLPPNPTP